MQTSASHSLRILQTLAVLTIGSGFVNSPCLQAAEQLVSQPQSMMAAYEVKEWNASFRAKIDLVVTIYRDGEKVFVSSRSVKTEVLENRPPNGFLAAGIARVEWELTIDGLKHGHGFKYQITTSNGNKPESNKDGSSTLKDGEEIREVDLEHKGERTNNVSQTHRNFAADTSEVANTNTPGSGRAKLSGENEKANALQTDIEKLKEQIALYDAKTKQSWELDKKALTLSLSDKQLGNKLADEYGNQAEAYQSLVKKLKEQLAAKERELKFAK